MKLSNLLSAEAVMNYDITLSFSCVNKRTLAWKENQLYSALHFI